MAKLIKPRMKTHEQRMEELWFKMLLDTTIEKDQPLWEPPRLWFRASSVGTSCDRCLALDMLGHRIPFEARTLRIFKTGNAIESVILDTLRSAGTLISDQGEVEFFFKDRPLIKGHYDAIVQGFDQEYLLEVKSINEFDFAKLPTEHKPMLASDSPLMNRYPKYIQQWNTYSASPNTPNEGMILFEAKNSQKHKVYNLRHDISLFTDLLNRLELIQKTVMEGMLPARKSDVKCYNYLCKKLPPESVDVNMARIVDEELRG